MTQIKRLYALAFSLFWFQVRPKLTGVQSPPCPSNNRCVAHYRKPDGAGDWIYGDE